MSDITLPLDDLSSFLNMNKNIAEWITHDEAIQVVYQNSISGDEFNMSHFLESLSPEQLGSFVNQLTPEQLTSMGSLLKSNPEQAEELKNSLWDKFGEASVYVDEAHKSMIVDYVTGKESNPLNPIDQKDLGIGLWSDKQRQDFHEKFQEWLKELGPLEMDFSEFRPATEINFNSPSAADEPNRSEGIAGLVTTIEESIAYNALKDAAENIGKSLLDGFKEFITHPETVDQNSINRDSGGSKGSGEIFRQ